MSVAEIKQAISLLSGEEFNDFRRWLADFEMSKWDKQIDEDSSAGRLDSMIEKAMGDYRAGRATDL